MHSKFSHAASQAYAWFPVVCLYHVLKAVVLHQAELCWQLKLVHFHLHCKYAGEFWLHGCAFVLDGLMKVIKQKANMG